MLNELKTPCYIIDKNELDENYKKLIEAVKKHWDNYIIGYSYKTNALPWIIKHFDELGCFAEVVSDDEYELASFVGVDNRVIYNGPIKTKKTFMDALEKGSIVNVDSNREIEWLAEVKQSNRKVGIRINFDIEKYCPGQSQCANEGGRFGFCFENGELEKAIKRLREIDVDIQGIHLHTSSKTRGLDIYRAISEMACIVKDKFELELKYVDVGGGFFGGLSTKPQFDEYISLMKNILSKKFDVNEVKLILEPGMSVIGSPISYVTSVVDVKDTTFNRFVITDGSRTSIDPLMAKSSYFHHYERCSTTEIMHKQVICGYTCMEHDRLYEAVDEPELLPGDRIIYEKVGAYTMCLTPLFIKYFPDVYLMDGNEFIKVRNAWKPEEYVTKCRL